jgi:hypothetical protein
VKLADRVADVLKQVHFASFGGLVSPANIPRSESGAFLGTKLLQVEAGETRTLAGDPERNSGNLQQ